PYTTRRDRSRHLRRLRFAGFADLSISRRVPALQFMRPQLSLRHWWSADKAELAGKRGNLQAGCDNNGFVYLAALFSSFGVASQSSSPAAGDTCFNSRSATPAFFREVT